MHPVDSLPKSVTFSWKSCASSCNWIDLSWGYWRESVVHGSGTDKNRIGTGGSIPTYPSANEFLKNWPSRLVCMAKPNVRSDETCWKQNPIHVDVVVPHLSFHCPKLVHDVVLTAQGCVCHPGFYYKSCQRVPSCTDLRHCKEVTVWVFCT